MANPDHLLRLQSGIKKWNSWRSSGSAEPDLSGANLIGADLRGANLRGANLSGAILLEADLRGANLRGANLRGADLSDANLSGANLRGANLSLASLSLAILSRAILLEANLSGANFSGAILRGADLRGAKLTGARLVRTVLDGADMTGCRIYGLSAWDVQLEGTIQSNLVITPGNVPIITVDDLEVAQFIYLLLNNQKIRHVIDTITSKVVLILGRFTPERKAVLDAIRDELRKRDYLPVLFDFEKPSNRDITETVATLAHMARFVIADLSDPKSIPHELAHVAPLLPSVPIIPLIVKPQSEYVMFEHFFGFRHVLKPFRYRDEAHLLSVLQQKVIAPAEKLAKSVAGKRNRR